MDGNSMQLSLRVPAVCSLSADAVSVDPARASASAMIFESCNTSQGFDILAMHRPLLAGERAQVRYDGQTSELLANGMSPIQFRQGARYGAVPVELNTQGLSQGLSVSFAITPV